MSRWQHPDPQPPDLMTTTRSVVLGRETDMARGILDATKLLSRSTAAHIDTELGEENHFSCHGLIRYTQQQITVVISDGMRCEDTRTTTRTEI